MIYYTEKQDDDNDGNYRDDMYSLALVGCGVV